MRFRYLLAVLMALMSITSQPMQALAVPFKWTVQQLTFDGGAKSAVSVCDDRLAWLGSDGSHLQVFTWKAGDSKPRQLTFDQNNHGRPTVSADRVAWDGPDSTAEPFNQVFTWNAGDVAPEQITFGAERNFVRGMSGNRIVWLSENAGGRSFFTWAPSDLEPVRIPMVSEPIGGPLVSGNRIVWRAPGSGVSDCVLTWHVGDSEPSQLTTAAAVISQGPLISGNRIFWTQSYVRPWPYSGSLFRLFSWTPSDLTPVQLTGDLQLMNGLAVGGNRIVWTESQGVSPVAPPAPVVTQIVGDSTPTVLGATRGYPLVSEDLVLWSEGVGTPAWFATWRSGDSTATRQAVPAFRNIALSGDRLAWTGLATPGQVFTAVNETDTTAATSITIRTAASYTTSGKTVVLSGAVGPSGVIGRNIVVNVKKPSSPRWTYSSARTVYGAAGGPAWQYKYYFKAGMMKGSYTYQAVVPECPGFHTSTSPSTVTVRLK